MNDQTPDHEPRLPDDIPAAQNLSGPRPPTPDPRFPNWPLLYTVVLAELVILVIIFYAFTKAFA